jgi:hypothetical protein
MQQDLDPELRETEGHPEEDDLLAASLDLAQAREAYAEAFLRAKISHRNPTDRQAEASAQIEAGRSLLAAETIYFMAKADYAAALGSCSCQ